MSSSPDCIEFGARASLFPVLAETNKERRITSIFLAVLSQIPDLAESIMKSVDVRVGKRTTVDVFTEVVLTGKTDADNRPDGLLVITTKGKKWSALIEAKIRKNPLDEDQVRRYVELARANGIDAVITISNQFVSQASHSPVPIPKTMLRSTDLFHWSWAWITTQCEILAMQDVVADPVQAFVLDQFVAFIKHPSTGMERFTQMAPSWKDVVQDVTNAVCLKKASREVEDAVACWQEETRDLSLHLSSSVSVPVVEKISRKLVADPRARLKDGTNELVDTKTLSAKFHIPNAAADLEVCANLATRTISASMTLKAPTDRKSTKARINWLNRMIPGDDARILVQAHWPGKTQATAKSISELRRNPGAIQPDNQSVTPHKFDVILVERTGKRFSGRRTFIEDLERIVPEFYDLVGSRLREWHAPPPAPAREDVNSKEQSGPGRMDPDAGG